MKIPNVIRGLVWETYKNRVGDLYFCYCCRKNNITPWNFDCGHVVPRSKNGSDTVENLRPICKPCNQSMGAQNLYKFKKMYFPESSLGKDTKNE